MKRHFKEHLQALKRYQTSVGRDLEHGIRLDRNERISDFSSRVMKDILKQFKGYSLPISPDSESLYRAIAANLKVPREKIYITSGITEGIRILYETLSKPGDNVVSLDPTYPFYAIYPRIYQVEYRKFGFTPDFGLNWDSLYKNIDDKTVMVTIPNPNLPIESVLTPAEIRKIALKCKQHSAALVIDEAYYYFGGPTVLDLVDELGNLIVMRTFSKAYGMAGMRIGFMVSTPENIEYLSKTRSLVESNTFSMAIAEYMLNHLELRDENVKEIEEGRVYLKEALTKMGVKFFGGNVTNGMLIFLENNAQTKELIAYLRERKIYIRGSFEPPCDNCVRVSLGHRKAMEKFIAGLKAWRKEKRGGLVKY